MLLFVSTYDFRTWFVCLFVCLSVRENLSHQESQLHEIFTHYVLWANLTHYEARFWNFDF